LLISIRAIIDFGGFFLTNIIAIVNQKGGVGKTTTTVNLASYLANFGKRVLLVDADPQGNATSGIGVTRDLVKTCLYDLLISDTPDPFATILQSPITNLDVIPATTQLAGAEIELVNEAHRENRLKNVLEKVRGSYDYVLIDCPPSLSLITVNVLTATDEVIIPIQCEYYALEGISHLVNTIELVRNNLNPNLKIAGIILTMYNSRTLLSEQVAEEARKYFGAKVYQTIIPRNVRLAEAPSFGQSILFYDPSSNGAKAYESLTKEVMGYDYAATGAG
jgi:chromosome partitioning protein